LGTRRVLLGVSWAGGIASIRVRDNASLLSVELPLLGLHLNYHADEHSLNLCLGHVPFRRGRDAYVECVNRPAAGDRKCNRCAANDATFAANLHHAHTKDPDTIDPAVAKHMVQPNVAYLAAFRDGSIKIGTSTLKRQQERLTEQGAWMAQVVATSTDGFAIRDLEDKVTRDLGLPQSVSGRRKVAGLANPTSNQLLENKLSELAIGVRRVITELGDDRLKTKSESWHSHAVTDSTWENVHAYAQNLKLGNHDLTVRAVSGRQIAFSRSGADDIFVADLGPLLGIELELGEFDPSPIPVQDSLF
jgi:hypothetical protein